MWKHRAITHVGLAITPQFVRATVLSQHGETLQCDTTQTISRADIDLPEALVKLRQAIEYQRQPTIVGMAYCDVMVKNITVDASLNDIEIMTYLSTQAPELFGYTAEQIHLDYEATPFNEKQQHLRVIIAHQHHIKRLIAQCTTAGFHIKAIDLDLFALTRATAFFFKATQNTGIISLEQNALLLCALENNQLYYATQADYPEKNTSTLEAIVPALHRALQFLSSSHPNKNLSNLFITGETASDAVAKTIAQKTGLPTRVATPTLLQDKNALLSAGFALWGLSP